MSESVRADEWIEGLARASGEAPEEPGRYAQQLDGIEAKLRQRRVRRQGWFVAGGITLAAAAGVVLAWNHSDARTELLVQDTRFEAPAWGGREQASGEAHAKTPRRVPRPRPSRAIVHDEPPQPRVAPDPEPVPRPPKPTASAKDLLARAQKARADRRTDDARTALSDLRSRFPNSDAAEQATFLLGRVEYELAGDRARAREWFSRYVAEYPGGRFVASARGRILKDLEMHGSQSEVAAAAREYVEHHPDGPYRDLADRVLADEE